MKSGRRMMAAQVALAACVLLTYAVAADNLSWRETTFNAVDGDADGLIIAVGDHGAIVHITDSGGTRRVQAPTYADLLDVHVGSTDFAVTVGQGVVLLWNGESWRHLTDVIANARYYRAWASPDELLVLYAGGIDANRVCPWIPGAQRQPFCRQFSAPMGGACGNHNTIHLVLANGEIYRVNDALLGKDGGFGPVFRPDEPLELKFAWVAEETCTPDQIPGFYGWDISGGLVQFDGRSWRALDPTLTEMAKLQALNIGSRTYLQLPAPN